MVNGSGLVTNANTEGLLSNTDWDYKTGNVILNPDGTIKNAFVNLFDVNFEKDLK